MITQMWGTVDGTCVIFNNQDGQWVCTVPADLNDGTYILELWIRNSANTLLYTTATVYLCDSKLTQIEWLDDDILVAIQDDIQVKAVGENGYKIYKGRDEIRAILDIEQETRADYYNVSNL